MWFVVSIVMQQKYPFASILNVSFSEDGRHADSLFASEKQKRVAGRVHDVTDLAKMAALRAMFLSPSYVLF